MHVAAPSSLITTGVPEVPFECLEQAEVGALISGPGAQHIWRVLQHGPNEGWIEVQLVESLPVAPAHEHTWIARGEGALSCICGRRRQRVSDLLPVTTPRCRVIIPPPDTVFTLDRYTLYATTHGDLIHALEGTWSAQMPLLPQLQPIWCIPAALQTWLASHDVPSPVNEDRPVT